MATALTVVRRAALSAAPKLDASILRVSEQCPRVGFDVVRVYEYAGDVDALRAKLPAGAKIHLLAGADVPSSQTSMGFFGRGRKRVREEEDAEGEAVCVDEDEAITAITRRVRALKDRCGLRYDDLKRQVRRDAGKRTMLAFSGLDVISLEDLERVISRVKDVRVTLASVVFESSAIELTLQRSAEPKRVKLANQPDAKPDAPPRQTASKFQQDCQSQLRLKLPFATWVHRPKMSVRGGLAMVEFTDADTATVNALLATCEAVRASKRHSTVDMRERRIVFARREGDGHL